MYIFSILTLLLLPFSTTSTYSHHNCLRPSQVHNLITSWLQVRSLAPADPTFSSLLNKTVSSTATFEDETISYFIPPGGVSATGPYVKSRAEYLTLRGNGEAISTTTTPVFEAQVDGNGRKLQRSFCDGFVVRFVSSAKVKVEIPVSTAKINDPVIYKGIDLVLIDVKKAKIASVYTSADYIREIKQKGFPPS